MEQHHATAVLTRDVGQYDVSVHESPEVECVVCDWSPLGIDEARELATNAHRTPLTASIQLFVVKTTFITHEAQNALLKLLEEPPASSRFVLVVPGDVQLLPTLRSRLAIQSATGLSTDVRELDTFLKLQVADRLSEIEARSKAKDLDWQRALKQELLFDFGAKASELEPAEQKRLLLVAERLLTRGASNKMLLEELALTLPARV